MDKIIKAEADKALLSRMWSHTVGVVNQKRLYGSLPDGRRGNEEQPGTGALVRWKEHHCIATAKHVITAADKTDLRFFFRPTGALDTVSPEEFKRQGYIEHHPGWSAEIYKIIRCEWEDIALLTINPEQSFFNAEFFDFEHGWGDPAVGDWIGGAGFPTSERVHLRTERHGPDEEHIVGLALMAWDSQVIAKPESLIESISEEIPFDPKRHFLAGWNPIDPAMEMRGFSGSAVWTEAPSAKSAVWSTKLVYAGMCTNYYRPPDRLARMIKASVVKRFLQEALGTPRKPVRADGRRKKGKSRRSGSLSRRNS